MIQYNLYFSSTEDLLAGDMYVDAFLNNGIQIVVHIMMLPILMKYFGEFYAWPLSFLAILAQLSRAYFFVLYSFRSFLTGLSMNIFITLFTYFFVIVLFNIVSTEGIFRDEFLQLHDMILARSYLEKCLVLARQLLQPLENLVDAQEAVVKAMVTETLAGRLWMQEPILSATKNCQVAALVTQQWMLELRLTKTSLLMQQERSVVLGRMRTVLMRNFVLTLCQHFLNEYHAADPTNHLSFAVRIAPELTQIRIDEVLCRATLTHLCRRAMEIVQNHVLRARCICRMAQTKRLDVNQAPVGKGRGSKDTISDEAAYMYWQKQSLIQHHLLLWIYPKSNISPDTNRPFRFADIRDLEMIMFSSAAHNDNSCGCNQSRNCDKLDSFFLESPFTLGSKHAAKVKLKTITPYQPPRVVFNKVGSVHTDEDVDLILPTRHRRTTAADLYTDYFSFTGRDLRIRPGARRSANYDEGIVLHHTQFHSYQRVLLPYLLTSHSTWFAETVSTSPQFLTRALINHIDTVQSHMQDARSQQLYAQYLRQSFAFFLPVAGTGSIGGAGVRATRLIGTKSQSSSSTRNELVARTSPSASSLLSTSLAPSPGTSTHLIFPDANQASAPNDKTSNAHSSSLVSVTATGSGGSGDKSSSSTSSSGTGEEEHASASSDDKDSPASGNTSVTGSDTPSSLPASAAPPVMRPAISFRKPGMNVAVILSFADTSFRQHSVNNQVMLGSVGWLGRLETLKPPHMPTSFFHEAECIFIEYMSAPPAHLATSGPCTSSSGGSTFIVKPTVSYGGGGYGCHTADKHFPGETTAERVSAGREYLRLVLQWLRFGGYDGIIVLLGDVSMEENMRQDCYDPADCAVSHVDHHSASPKHHTDQNNPTSRHSVSLKSREENLFVLRSDQQSDADAFNLIMRQNVLNRNNSPSFTPQSSRRVSSQSEKSGSSSRDEKISLDGKKENDQTQYQQQLQAQAVAQHTAVLADRFLTIPLNEEKLKSLLPECERRVVELALGVWHP
jgi:hypothetical protein